MTDDIIIRVRDLKTAYGSHVVHEHLDLDIRRGEIIGVIGPSGCGKSVLLRAITGLKEPSAGSIEVFGKRLETLDPDERAAVERSWGVMFQDGALFSNLTVRENVMVPMKEHTDLSPQLCRELADMKILMGMPAQSSRPICQVACASARPLRGPWHSTRNSCFWMNLPPGSTRSQQPISMR